MQSGTSSPEVKLQESGHGHSPPSTAWFLRGEAITPLPSTSAGFGAGISLSPYFTFNSESAYPLHVKI